MNRGTLEVSLRLAALAVASLAIGCAGDDAGDDGANGSSGTGNGSTGSMTTQPDPSDTAQETGMDSMDTMAPTTDPPATGSTDAADTGDSGTTASVDESSGSGTGVAACVGMSFFATSEGSGKDGGNLGGLDGADARCQALAEAAGQGKCTWRAYLSTDAENARDRIGAGPWENFDGDVVATDPAGLHTEGLSNGDPQLVVDETGNVVPGNQHDILTGSLEDGTYKEGTTCQQWTSNSSDDEAGVGHSDIPNNPQFSPSWNEAHVVGGCAPNDLQSTGGAGRLYCFAL